MIAPTYLKGTLIFRDLYRGPRGADEMRIVSQNYLLFTISPFIYCCQGSATAPPSAAGCPPCTAAFFPPGPSRSSSGSSSPHLFFPCCPCHHAPLSCPGARAARQCFITAVNHRSMNHGFITAVNGSITAGPGSGCQRSSRIIQHDTTASMVCLQRISPLCYSKLSY